MASKNKVKCINCGREISGIKAAKSDGWIINEDGAIYCCCLCISEYKQKERAAERASKRKKKG